MTILYKIHLFVFDMRAFSFLFFELNDVIFSWYNEDNKRFLIICNESHLWIEAGRVNDTHRERLCFTQFSTRMTAWLLLTFFHVFTQSIKFYTFYYTY